MLSLKSQASFKKGNENMFLIRYTLYFVSKLWLKCFKTKVLGNVSLQICFGYSSYSRLELLLADPCCIGLPFLLLFYKHFTSVDSTDLLNVFMKSISALQVASSTVLLQRRTEKGVHNPDHYIVGFHGEWQCPWNIVG